MAASRHSPRITGRAMPMPFESEELEDDEAPVSVFQTAPKGEPDDEDEEGDELPPLSVFWC
jgi:hypothetical protein